MSLSINLNSSGASSNLQHLQQKPMSISSITSSPLPNSASLVVNSPPETNTDMSSPPLSHKHNSRSPNSPMLSYPMSMPNSPDSPTFQHTSAATTHYPYPQYHNHHQQQQQRRSHVLYHIEQHHQNRHHPYQQRDTSYATSHHPVNSHSRNSQDGHYRTTRSSSISSTTSATAPPLTLQERRQRNKAASAKYRAKKNQQHGEMRMLISSLTKENDLLQRQLDHVQRDNEKLKVTCDKLRGKMMAEKMLKKLLHSEHPQAGDLQGFVDDEENDDDDDMDSLDEDDNGIANEQQYQESVKHAHRYNGDSDGSYYSANNQPQPQSNSAFIANTQNNRFDEDIDFEDEEDDNYSDENQPNYSRSGRTRS
ncbi:hypothetical protein MAM1_0028d02264 [Mucor ambiguus]|uniref:BZIP domain-containing protein n=1 Tax=Mucor ambiguus TaxID=91626 RepID=A0A0C9MID9_9FUNG|nr:hypothetical protein MAM1_0028d02264 [Mucor ambiguus]